MKLIGVTNHTAGVIIDKYNLCKAIVLSVGELLPVSSKERVILVLSYSDLIKNLDTLNSLPYKNTTVFLFASVLRLSDLSYCYPLDYRLVIGRQGFQYMFNDNLPDNLPLEVVSTKIVVKDFLTKAINNVKEGSLLNPLMSIIYCLPANKQAVVKTKVLRAVYEGNCGTITTALSSSSLGVPKSIVAKLIAVLQDEKITGKYIRAFSIIRDQVAANKPITYAAITKSCGVDKYELMYILAILKRSATDKASVGSISDFYSSRIEEKKVKEKTVKV